jgi:recombination associated protein RdgC
VLVDGNYKKAENLLALLRKAIGSLPVVPFEGDCGIGDKLDDLVLEKGKLIFTLGNKATFGTPEVTHSISKGSLYDSNAKDLVNDGYMTTSLQLELEGTLFTLKDTLDIDGIKFDKELFSELEKGDEAGSMLIKLSEVDKLVKEVIEYLK